MVCFDHIRFRFPLRKNFSPPPDGRIQLSILPRNPSAGWQRQDDYPAKTGNSSIKLTAFGRSFCF